MAKANITEKPRAKGWTVFSRANGGITTTLADGEIVPLGFRYDAGRPATEAEIAEEQTKRENAVKVRRCIEAFRARPEYQDADLIRSTIEMMEYDNHPLDCMTPEEWRALRIKICGPLEA